MADSEKTVAIKFTVESKSALDNINKLIIASEKIKEQFKDLAGTSKASFAKVAEALKQTKAQEIERQIADVQAGKGAPEYGFSAPDKEKRIAALRKEQEEYNKALSFAVNELTRAADAEQKFVNSFNSQPMQEQLRIINEINAALRNRVQASGINLTDKNQLRALENAQVKAYAQQRLAQVPTAKPGEMATGNYEAGAFKAASDDIRNYRALVKTELNKIVSEYRATQKQIEADQKQSDKNRLEGQKQYTNAVITIKKEEARLFIEEAKKQREAERQGLSGSELISKAKEQADAAVYASQQANEAYRQQVEVRKALAQQLINSQDNVTKNELEEAKKREAALKLEADTLKQNASNAQREYKKIADASKQTTQSGSALSSFGNIAKYVFGTILGVTAVGALRNMISFMGEASNKALELSKTLFTLNLAVRQMQRQGQQTSVGQLTDEIKAFRSEFGYFSELEVTKAFAEATNKLSNLGYTAEQVANVVRVGMIVYVTDLTGRFNDLGEAINGVTNYLASGYGESLERSGFISGRAGDKLKAYEMGLGQTLAMLDPLTLSQTRYNLIMGQAGEKSKDAAEFIGTLAGQYKAAEAEITNATVNIGRATDDLVVQIAKLKAQWLDFILNLKIPGVIDLKKTIAFGDINDQLTMLATKYDEVTERIRANNLELAKLSERGITDERVTKLEDENAALEDQKKKIGELSTSLIDMSKTTGEALKKVEFPKSPEGFFPSTIKFLKDLTSGDIIKGIDELDPDKIKNLFDNLSKFGAIEGVTYTINPMLEKKVAESSIQDWDKWFSEEIKSKISDVVETKVEVKPTFDLDASKLNETYSKLFDGLYKIQDNYNERSAELWNDYVNDVGGKLKDLDGTVINVYVKGNLEIEHEEKLKEIQDTAKETLDAAGQAAKDYESKIAEAQRNYATQLAQSIRQYNIRRAEMERKYRLNELQAERQFQEEMRKLREGYLMDLEGALRERDALQVIRLAREYDLQVTQRKRQYEDEKKTRRENYEEEKKQAAIEQQERERQLAEELANRLASIKAERDAEKAQAQAEADKATAEENARYQKAISDRARAYQQAQQELELQTGEATRDFAKQLQDDKIITDAFLADFATKLESYFGKGGAYDTIMAYFKTAVANTGVDVSNTVTEIMKTLEEIFKLPSKATTMDVPGFSGLENAPKVGQPTEESALAPIEIPTTVSTDELKGQVDTAIAEASKTVAPIEIPTVILPPSGGKATPSLSETARTPNQPTAEEPIELPIVVSNEKVMEEIRAALEEANTLRSQGLADSKAAGEAEQAELEGELIARLQAFRSTLTEETKTSSDAVSEFIDLLNNYFRQGGRYDIIMKFFEDRTLAAGEKVKIIFFQIFEYLKSLLSMAKAGQEVAAGLPRQTDKGGKPKSGRYSGGADVFTKPTTLQVSEYEPEFVSVIPLSKLTSQQAQDIAASPSSSETAKMLALSKLSKTTVNSTESTQYNSPKNISNSYGGNSVTTLNTPEGKESNNKIQLLVGMEEGLFAKVVDMTLDQAAEIMFDVQRNN